MRKETGGYAFPSLNAECTGIESDGQERWDMEQSGGMTLRDYFAGKALAGMLARPQSSPSTIAGYKIGSEAHYARASYNYADAMIAERAK